MNVRLLEPAQVELDSAVGWYGEQAPGLGDAFLLWAIKVLSLIERFPFSVTYTMDAADRKSVV